MTADELFRMAYRGETDGHTRAWHAVFARDRRELDALTRGANRAKADAESAEVNFRQNRNAGKETT